MALSRINFHKDPVIHNLKSSSSKYFKDPLYSLIEVDAQAMQIIDTPEFQRLRYIRQTGLVYYLYPSANHTRFEHSIGCYYLACKMLETISLHQPEVVDQKDLGLVSIAALIHDLGHGPFSHSFDSILKNARKLTISHEQRSVLIFKAMNDKYSWGITEEDIYKIEGMILGISREERKNFLYQIVSNAEFDIDVDKFDYLARDSYFTTCVHLCDTARLVKKVQIFSDEGRFYGLDGSKSFISFMTKMDIELANVFWNRYFNFHKIYTHPVSLVLSQMTEDAVYYADKYFHWTDRIDDLSFFLKLDDSILRDIERCEADDENIRKAQEILQRIYTRDLYSTIHHSFVIKPLEQDYSQEMNAALSEIGEGDLKLIRYTLTLNKHNDHEDMVKSNIWFSENFGGNFVASKASRSTFSATHRNQREVHFVVVSTNSDENYCRILSAKILEKVEKFFVENPDKGCISSPIPKEYSHLKYKDEPNSPLAPIAANLIENFDCLKLPKI